MSDAIESKDEEIIGVTIEEGARAKDTRKVVEAVEGIVRKNTFTIINFASCGHPLRSGQDIGGKCQIEGCISIPCNRCFRLCDRCGAGLCNRHQKKRADGTVFCKSCRWKIMILGWRGESGPQVG